MGELMMPMAAASHPDRLNTKIAVALDEELPTWQKLNVTAFLASGIAATAADSIGQRYHDADGTGYAPMFGQPVMVFGADKARLIRTLNRAVDRGVTPAIFTMALFATGHDDDNRAALAAVRRAELDVVGVAIRAERKVVDKIVHGLKLHR